MSWYEGVLAAAKGVSGLLTGGWWRKRGTRPRDLDEWAALVVEKVRSSSVTGTLNFLPYLDQYTEETQEIRDAYRKMLREPMVKAALQTKVLAVASLDVQIVPEEKSDPEARRQASFARHCFKRVSGGTPRLATNILFPGLIDGWSLNEKVWATEDRDGPWHGKWVWAAWKNKDTRHVQLGTDPYRNIEAIRANTYNAGRLFDPDDFVVFSYFDLFENAHGMSDFRAAYRGAWIKNTAWQLRGVHLDKYGSPFLIGQYPAGSGDVRRVLETALQNAKASTWLSVPVGAAITPLEMSTRGTADYESAIRDCDRDILVGITGGHLQQLEGQVGGARGNTQVHKETAELMQWMLAVRLAWIYTRETEELLRMNFASPRPMVVTLEAVDQGELKARSEIDLNLQQLGLKLSKREAYENYGRSEPVDEADVLTPPMASPMPGGMGGPGGPGGGPSMPEFAEDEPGPFARPPALTG